MNTRESPPTPHNVFLYQTNVNFSLERLTVSKLFDYVKNIFKTQHAKLVMQPNKHVLHHIVTETGHQQDIKIVL